MPFLFCLDLSLQGFLFLLLHQPFGEPFAFAIVFSGFRFCTGWLIHGGLLDSNNNNSCCYYYYPESILHCRYLTRWWWWWWSLAIKSCNCNWISRVSSSWFSMQASWLTPCSCSWWGVFFFFYFLHRLIDSAFKTFASDLQGFFLIKSLENLDMQFSTWCFAEIDSGGLIFPNSNSNHPKSIGQGQ